MVPTAQLTALHQLAGRAGAKMLLTGDPAQLPAVGAGGALGMLARQHGYYQLTRVQRMAEAWEREASLRLRAGDAAVLADYDRRGRLAEGTAEQMGTAAYRAWLADYLSGKDSLLIAATKEQAAELSGRARADLVAMGLVDEHGITLADGNTAGVGDLVQARHNDRSIRDQEGRWAANRDVWRIEAIVEDPDADENTAIVRRDLGRDPSTGERRWSTPFEAPAEYLSTYTVLAYATTVHAAQGRTVDTCHALITDALIRALVYVALTRGRLANYGYVITETPSTRRPAHAPEGGQAGQRRSTDLRPGTRPAAALGTPASHDADGGEHQGQQRRTPDAEPAVAAPADPGAPWAPEADRLSVLIATLERDETEVPALDVLRDELARAGHLAHLGAIWTDLAAEESGRRYGATLRRVLSEDQYQRLAAEDARATLHRLVRTAELAGHDPDALLAQAVALRSLDNATGRGRADDISKVLHSRVREIAGDPVPRAASYAERTPEAADPETGRFLRELAQLMDERTAELGDRAADTPPTWALDHLGPVPDDPLERTDWSRRAGAVAAYRERYGRTDDRDPIGRQPAAPEARADWHAAHTALGRTEDQRAADATNGELWATRARYEREMVWAPPHVGEDLRQTVLARREHETAATLARARAQATTGPERGELAARAQASEQLAGSLSAREQVLSAIDTQRARWHVATEQAREDAREATAELRRRFPHAGELSPRDLRGPEGLPDQEPDRDQAPAHAGPAADRPSEQQRAAIGQDLQRAAEAAERARRILDAREARDRQAAEREAQRQREEPAPGRWPHRDPGYPAPRREEPQPERTSRPERTPGQLAAESFPYPPSPRPPRRDGPAPEPPPHRRPKPPEPRRDGPGLSR